MDGQNPFTITTVHVCCLFVGCFFSLFSQSLVLIYSMWKCCDSVIGKTKQNNDKPGNCMFPKYDKYTHHWQTVYVNLNHAITITITLHSGLVCFESVIAFCKRQIPMVLLALTKSKQTHKNHEKSPAHCFVERNSHHQSRHDFYLIYAN